MPSLELILPKHSLAAASIRLIVTTATSASSEAQARARSIADQLSAEYVIRRNGNGGLSGMLDDAEVDRALIVEERGLAISHRDGTTFRWHPNLGFVRALNLTRGQTDTFVEAAQLAPGERVLDCTLGFGSEALLAALRVGSEGNVVGLESVPELALITAAGMQERAFSQPALTEAVRQIEVLNEDYHRYLLQVKEGRFDVICFDPFFTERLKASAMNINPLLRFGNPAPLEVDSVLRAIAVAGRLVLVKHPRAEELPEPLVELRRSIVQAKRSPVRYSLFAPRPRLD